MLKVRGMAAEGQYRAETQSPEWIGRAVADVLGLDAEDDKTPIKALLKVWYANGVLRQVERLDAARRPRMFIAPGEWAEG